MQRCTLPSEEACAPSVAGTWFRQTELKRDIISLFGTNVPMAHAVVKDCKNRLPGNTMKVIIDKFRCNGWGICENICSQVCPCNKSKNKIEEEIFSDDYEDACRKAVKYCPAGAITIE